MYNEVYKGNVTTIPSSSSYIFANDVSYSSGTYTLKATNAANKTISSSNWSSSYTSLSNNHYTCLSSDTTCTNVYYVYFTTNTTFYYITLTNGKKVEDALDSMLGTNGTNVNVTSSTIKMEIDTWYENNMSGYDDYLEDTIFCNDRKVITLNGWNPNGGDNTKNLYLNSYSNESDLSCTNVNDRFTTNTTNGNGKLTYKVGLMTFPEASLMSDEAKTTTENYWLMSPSDFYYIYPSNRIVASFTYGVLYQEIGIRPVISLAYGVRFERGGDGSTTNPYVVREVI